MTGPAREEKVGGCALLLGDCLEVLPILPDVSYRDLKDGWDGEESKKPNYDAIDDALSFIDLLPLGMELPEPMVAADGEVGFYWKKPNVYIDIGFKGNGKISYYARSGGFVAKDICL
jgi:hypothetical protein